MIEDVPSSTETCKIGCRSAHARAPCGREPKLAPQEKSRITLPGKIRSRDKGFWGVLSTSDSSHFSWASV